MNRTLKAVVIAGALLGSFLLGYYGVAKYQNDRAAAYAKAVNVVETVLASSPAEQVAPFDMHAIPKGARAVVPGWQWIDIERRLKGSPEDYFPSSTCAMEEHGLVEAIGMFGSKVLVSYTPPPKRSTTGMPCDGGEVFFLDGVDFVTMTARTQRYAREAKEKELAVEALTKGR